MGRPLISPTYKGREDFRCTRVSQLMFKYTSSATVLKGKWP